MACLINYSCLYSISKLKIRIISKHKTHQSPRLGRLTRMRRSGALTDGGSTISSGKERQCILNDNVPSLLGPPSSRRGAADRQSGGHQTAAVAYKCFIGAMKDDFERSGDVCVCLGLLLQYNGEH